ncbi:MAG: family 43 glycosylhydrolase [Clostridia bacterium]|nr:family 43 glycosylhydrolase [Clostridia bacterium]
MENLPQFIKEYYELKTRVAPFMLKTDAETVKTVSVITILLERAYNVHAGASTHGRFGFGPGHTVENYMSRAKSYIETLESGKYPLKGRFTEPGVALVDHSFIERDGRMHLFYNRGYIGYEWDTMPVLTVGHAVTDDLITWTVEPPVLSAEAGLHEDYQVWSPGVAEKDGRYYMYYTGVNVNVAQAICLAVSDDLYTWKKYDGNPVVKPGAWGPWSDDRWSDCRDAMVFVDDDGIAYMYYCTSKYNEAGAGPAVGVASSADMINWRDEGAYTFDICDTALESPFVMKRGGKYYMFYTNCNHGTAYAVSDNPVNGWRSLGMLIPWTVPPPCPANVPSCAEVFEFRGKWYISSCLREPGCEQYLEIFGLSWQPDGTVKVTDRIE